MAKKQSEYVCSGCGAKTRQFFGRCPECHAWGTMQEQTLETVAIAPSSSGLGNKAALRGKRADPTEPARLRRSLQLSDISDFPQARIPSGYSEFDRVLGGGIVPGSLVLLGGDPGIGKSTLLLKTAMLLADRHPILYVAAEESGQQIKMRWQRLGGKVPEVSSEAVTSGLYLLPETDLEMILAELEALRPRVAVIDSIQALYFSALSSAPGSVAQVRECTSALMRLAKQLEITMLIVGHVTKDGSIAGPKVLEHLVDTVLQFEGDRFASHRLLRAIKNRFGATHELGVFEMVSEGLEEVKNPSALFMGDREDYAPGSATIVACEGTRPLVVELQALVSPTSYPSPRRSVTGLEFNRLTQILAVLEKRVGLPLSKFDAYVSSVGGLNVGEPAADLGVAMAIVASFRDRIVNPELVIIGEVGLGGQVRPVSQIELRLKEAAKLGFTTAIVPKGQDLSGTGVEAIAVSRVVDAIGLCLMAAPSP
ncbi:MAG: DNA repair protein RadA [Synechococcales cyanobacterium RU_4_20]|nr:DNA repair protein RadA [Synechococcales cyanobacterium RU_4_20]NJR70369.1 DNA repair protein RadA [Synechococcales cyanobacterium CRU_2_2]